MNQFKWARWPLIIQLYLITLTTVIFTVLAVTLFAGDRNNRIFEAELKNEAELILDVVRQVSIRPLLMLDIEFLQTLTDQLVDNAVVKHAHIYDAKGNLLVDSTHPGNEYFQDGLLAAMAPNTENVSPNALFFWDTEHLVAGKSVLSDGQYLGSISIALSRQSAFLTMQEERARWIAIAIMVVLVSGLLSFLLGGIVTRPLRQLIYASNKIA